MFLFMMTSLDGYMEGKDHDLSWHHVDEEFNIFATKQLQEADTIVMGKNTYQLMESYWPTPQGMEDDPMVAAFMNTMPKVVVSHSLPEVQETAYWKNIQHIKDNVAEEIKKIKEGSGKAVIVLGSNNLCVTLLQENLLDEIRIMVNPVVIGEGTPLFSGLGKKPFTFRDTRKFSNGNMLLTYYPQ